MFDFSIGQITLTAVAAAVLIGRKDLPKVARGAGRGIGKMVGFVARTRAGFEEASSAGEIGKIKHDLAKSISELEQLRTEMSMASAAGVTRAVRAVRATGVQQDVGDTASKNESVSSSSSPIDTLSSPEALTQVSISKEAQSGAKFLAEAAEDEALAKEFLREALEEEEREHGGQRLR
eukprot:g2672.t1